MHAYLHTNIKYYMHTYQQFNDEIYVTSYNPYSHCLHISHQVLVWFIKCKWSLLLFISYIHASGFQTQPYSPSFLIEKIWIRPYILFFNALIFLSTTILMPNFHQKNLIQMHKFHLIQSPCNLPTQFPHSLFFDRYSRIWTYNFIPW